MWRDRKRKESEREKGVEIKDVESEATRNR